MARSRGRGRGRRKKVIRKKSCTVIIIPKKRNYNRRYY